LNHRYTYYPKLCAEGNELFLDAVSRNSKSRPGYPSSIERVPPTEQASGGVKFKDIGISGHRDTWVARRKRRGLYRHEDPVKSIWRTDMYIIRRLGGHQYCIDCTRIRYERGGSEYQRVMPRRMVLRFFGELLFCERNSKREVQGVLVDLQRRMALLSRTLIFMVFLYKVGTLAGYN